ncbi:AraC family transcriptional regulator [Flammeovirgaceae bacterium SG7u.111]|nr:AraC family transcriptional regulator [Flammeovirgaceae bacterium SG7u.132]WPO38037.1 AraC family transcriptional regulator [Flammeovirgaceae bacterium SG7u.111]
MFTWEKGRTLTSIQLIYVVTGKGVFESEDSKKKILPGDVIMLFPGEWHRYHPDPETGWEEYWIGFEGRMVDEFILPELFTQKKSIVKNIGYHDEVIYLLNQTLALAKKKSSFAKILTGIVFQLIAYLTEPIEHAVAGNKSEYIAEETINFIRLNVKAEIDFKELSSKFGVSYSYFRKMFKEETGVAPQQFLIDERLRLAERLLNSTKMTIEEISDRSGFQSVYYFSRLFKKKRGIAPSEMRK